MTRTRKSRCAPRSAPQWEAIVNEWRESGRTAEAVAARHGVSRTSLYGWAARLRAAETASPTRAPSFVGVSIVGPRPAATTTESRVELVTRSGRVIRVFGDVDTHALVRVLEAAEAC